MAICVVYDKATDKPINIIVAEITDQAPEGCYLSELPPNTIWNGTELVNTNPIVEEINNGS